MIQKSTLERCASGKSITDCAAVMWFKDRLYPLLMLLTRTKVKCKVETVNDCTLLPNKPIIFVPNHSAFTDTPIALRITKRRSYIFSGKQNLAFIDWVFFMLNGVIWVDRKSKEDTAASKDALLEYLAKGQSILWFPEGTWNLTPNLLMLPMKWGIIDIARQADAQIIPMALDYDREQNLCRVKFGSPITGDMLADKAEAIRDLRDTIATLRWDLMCSQPVLHRSELSPQQMKEEMYKVIEDYPPLDWEYERSCIYNPHPKVEIVPSALIPHWENAFLFAKDRCETQRM